MSGPSRDDIESSLCLLRLESLLWPLGLLMTRSARSLGSTRARSCRRSGPRGILFRSSSTYAVTSTCSWYALGLGALALLRASVTIPAITAHIGRSLSERTLSKALQHSRLIAFMFSVCRCTLVRSFLTLARRICHGLALFAIAPSSASSTSGQRQRGAIIARA